MGVVDSPLRKLHDTLFSLRMNRVSDKCTQHVNATAVIPRNGGHVVGWCGWALAVVCGLAFCWCSIVLNRECCAVVSRAIGRACAVVVFFIAICPMYESIHKSLVAPW